MPLPTQKIFAALELDNPDFFRPVCSHHFSGYLACVDVGRTHIHIIAVGNQQHFIEYNFFAGFCGQHFELYHIPFAYAVLLTATLEYCKHVVLRVTSPRHLYNLWHAGLIESLTPFSGRRAFYGYQSAITTR